jgi:hypothetical protein
VIAAILSLLLIAVSASTHSLAISSVCVQHTGSLLFFNSSINFLVFSSQSKESGVMSE